MACMGDNLEGRLWNTSVGPATYAQDVEKYQAAIFEQYKLCVEMADRISARRSLTNTFFLSLNSAIIAVLGSNANEIRTIGAVALLAGVLVLFSQCAAWLVIVHSYRQLNGAKFQVIGAFERRLPARAYSDAEWTALGEGQDWRKYLPLTHVEQWVPIIFACSYLLAFLAVLIGR